MYKPRAPTRQLPSVEFLRECFVYDSNTGELWWKRRPREHFTTNRAWATVNSARAGTRAGFANNKNRYSYIGVGVGQQYLAHRLIWKIVMGEEPPNQIDHADGNKTNDRFANLRAATSLEQNWNKGLRKDNLSGFRGVGRQGNRWRVRIKVGNSFRWLGTFETKEEASAIYETEARKLHGDFYRDQGP